MTLRFTISWKCYSLLFFFANLLLLFVTNAVSARIVQAKSPCNNSEISNSEGIITSPNYPLSYPDEVECEWKIRSPSNTGLKISILDLDIKEDENCPKSPCCSHHRLSISRDGEYIVLCGNNTIEKSFMISQPITFIRYFSSKPEKRNRGFKISYLIIHRCKSTEYRCQNGKCYLQNSYCDGIDDCGDRSDEINCPPVSHASRYGTRNKILQHEKDSIGMEAVCIEGMVQCPLSPYHCYSPETDLCDYKFDCPKGEDEIDCVLGCPKQISCSSGDGCYYPVQRCNSIRNCRDNSDETGCPAEPCVAMQFTCLNGACISGSAICDGDDDCGDFSDEENCTKSSFLKAAVVGLLTCIMLFCIVLGCMYHVYTARLRASANFVHHLETEPSDDDFVYREPPPAYSVAVNDPGILTCSSSDITERFFENDRAMRFQRHRTPRRNRRRQNSTGNVESASISQHRIRGSTTFVGSQNNALNGGGANSFEPKQDDNHKSLQMTSRSDFQEHLEFCGFRRPTQMNGQTVPMDNCQNESPCSSPSLSPSRESITSCTSLEEIEDLVNIFHH